MPDLTTASVAAGTADSLTRGHTVTVEFGDQDILTVEIPEGRGHVWVQYSRYENGSLIPGDGYKVEL